MLDFNQKNCRFIRMDKNEKLIKTILLENEAMKNEKGYVENACDAGRFISHLVFVITDGNEGEERPCLPERLTK